VQSFTSGSAVLGVYSSGGSVRIGVGAPDDLALDAFVMAAGAAGAFAVDGYASGAPRGTLHLRGGCVGRFHGAFAAFGASGALLAGYARDFRHDDRGLVPPCYPTPAMALAEAPRARRAPEAGLRLSSPFPNPARGTLRVRYALPRAGRVTLSVHDVVGRRVATLVDADQAAGEHEATWARTERRIPPGIYRIELRGAHARAGARVVRLD
jgi:hypothetical protein